MGYRDKPTPTLVVGDHMMVDKLVYRTRSPKRGEVMLFAFPEHPTQEFVKRVIAIEGDRLETKNGHPWINGWEIPHCKVGYFAFLGDTEPPGQHGDVEVEFLEGQAYLTFYDQGAGGFPTAQGPYVAKSEEFWVLGDNRNNSHDSRMWWGGQGGGVPRNLVKGRALLTWLSISPKGVDWSRVGVSLLELHLPAE